MTELNLLRNSETKTFKACRQKWWWAYHDELTAKQDAVPLLFGTWVHAAMEQWYIPGRKRGTPLDKTFEKIYTDYLYDGGDEIVVKVGRDTEGSEGERVDILDLGLDMLRGYYAEYGDDEHYEVIAPELSFQSDVHHSKTGKYLFTAVGQIDATVRDHRSNRIGFLEHKTGATLAPFGAPDELDEQSGMYWTFGPAYLQQLGVLKKDELPDFLEFNRLKKSMGDTRPTNEEGLALNQNGSVSKRQPTPRFKRNRVYRSNTDRRQFLKRSKQVMREMNLVRAGKLGHYKNPDRHCGYCEFKDACEAEETGGDWKEILKMTTNKWDPYEDYGLDMKDD